MALFRKIARSWQKPSRTEELSWILSTGIFFSLGTTKGKQSDAFVVSNIFIFFVVFCLIERWKCGDVENKSPDFMACFSFFFFSLFFVLKNFISVQQLFKQATDEKTCLKALWLEFFRNVTRSKMLSSTLVRKARRCQLAQLKGCPGSS